MTIYVVCEEGNFLFLWLIWLDDNIFYYLCKDFDRNDIYNFKR